MIDRDGREEAIGESDKDREEWREGSEWGGRMGREREEKGKRGTE